MLLNRYNTWVQAGKKELTAEELDNIFNGKAEKENATKNLEPHIEEQHREDVIYQGRQVKFVTYFIHDDDPHEMISVSSRSSSSSVAESPVFAGASSSVLIDSSTPKSSQDVSKNTHKFKELCLQQLDKIQLGEKSTKNVRKRRKVNPYGSIVTSANAIEVAEKNLEKGKSKSKRLKQEDEQSSEDPGEELLSVLEEDSDDSYDENEDEESNFRPNSDLTQVFPPGTERQAYMYLRKVWNEINLPVAEDAIKSKFFAAVYYPDQSKKRKPKLFVGRVLKRFLRDENGPTESLELDCLSLAVGSPEALEEPPKHLGHDIGVFLAHDIIAGPLDLTIKSSTKWNAPEYRLVVKTFNFVEKMPRQEEYNRLFSKAVS